MKYIGHFLLLGGLIWNVAVHSQIVLKAPLGEHMVMQQQTRLWAEGKAPANRPIRMYTGWDGLWREMQTDSLGNWKFELRSPVAGGPLAMTFACERDSLKLTDVMSGEVWLASGQSNMEFTLKMLNAATHYPAATGSSLASAAGPMVRIFTVVRDTPEVRKTVCEGSWKVAEAGQLDDLSGTAFFFARNLSDSLKKPVGVIVSAWGGSPIETWIPANELENRPDLGRYRLAPNQSPWWSGVPGKTFNGMINPLASFPFKGVLWYQGETNVEDYRDYPLLMQSLIESWRRFFGRSEMPFLFVQIAPYALYRTPVTAALLHDAQTRCLSIPNTGMAVTLDLVDNLYDIHPHNKWEVGKRLAGQALAIAYGNKHSALQNPLFRGMSTEANQAVLTFSNTGGPLRLAGQGNNFLIAGADHRFYPAQVTAKGTEIILSSPQVAKPEAVRYAFANNSTASVWGANGLPVPTFRTDNWDCVPGSITIKPNFDEESQSLAYTLVTKAREADILYAIDQSPEANSLVFRSPIPIQNPCTIRAMLKRNGYYSQDVASMELTTHKALGKMVEVNQAVDGAFKASGNRALTDGILGSADPYDGVWQGYRTDSLVLSMDMIPGSKSLKLNLLQDDALQNQLPKIAQLLLSPDGKNYVVTQTKVIRESRINEGGANRFTLELPLQSRNKALRLVLLSRHKAGSSDPNLILIDELQVQ